MKRLFAIWFDGVDLFTKIIPDNAAIETLNRLF